MAIKASFSPGAGLLCVLGDNPDGQITIGRNAAGLILVNGGAVAFPSAGEGEGGVTPPLDATASQPPMLAQTHHA